MGAWSRWSRGAVAGVGVGPTRDLGKHLYFFFSFVCFVCSSLLCSCGAALQHNICSCGVALQRSIAKKATPFFFFATEETKRRRRWQHCCRCLLLPLMEQRYNTTQQRRRQQQCCYRNPNLAKCGGEAQHLEKLGIWSPLGLPNV